MYYKYRVFDNKLITKSVRMLTLTYDEDLSRPLLHRPGQYAAISMNDRSRPTAARCFSIVSSPSQQRILQFSIRVNGLYTSALERLKNGDEIIVRGPFGNFVFSENKHPDVVMLAGGIGIAPFMSMIRYASDLKLKNKIHLVYSCRNQDDIPFFEELKELKNKNLNLKITYLISDGPIGKLEGLDVLSGRVTNSNIDELEFSYTNQTYMICGPSAYMTAMHSLLREKGVQKSNILTEAFSQGMRLQTDKLKSWPFNMYVLTGLSLIISGFFIMASDLYKTLPKLNKGNTALQSNTAPKITEENLLQKINALGPQVDTNTKQPPIIKYKQTAGGATTTTSAPVVAIKPAPAPAPTPKPTVTPKTRPRSTVS